MHAEPARQILHRRLAFQRLKPHLHFERRACCFRFDVFDLLRGKDQQTANQNLRYGQVFGGHLRCVLLPHISIPRKFSQTESKYYRQDCACN